MSTIILRNYQKSLIEDVFAAWNEGHRNVLVQSHTGSGKTVILTAIVERFAEPTVIIAHRMELVSQLSLALARAEITHSIISPQNTIRAIVNLHLQNGPRHYFNPNAPIIVASVDTLIKRQPSWVDRIKLVVIDEAAHVLKANKWGKALEMFPNAKGLLVTATPLRADGRGLGRQADGVVDVMIEGPSMRELISQGYLSKYRIFGPPNNLDLSSVNITASGDYSPSPLCQAIKKAQITGDVVAHYLKYAQGKLGITFVVSVEDAIEQTAAFEAAGVPAICIHAGTGISERAAMMRLFREGKVLQLVNVDICAEGVDVPAIGCLSLKRPTLSYGLHMQQIGRALRPAEGKEHAIILDHVGNIMHPDGTINHGFPDTPRIWSLDSRERKAKSESTAMKLRTCLNIECMAIFERNLDRCPYCSHPIPEPKARLLPEQVDGNLRELLPEGLKTITDEIARIESTPRIPRGASGPIAASIVKKHHARQETITALKDTIAQWAGVWHAKGESDTEILRRFYFTFGIDTLSAQTLSTKDALALMERIDPNAEYLKKKNG
jgi:superfamily II DNA or RNA helicase